MDAQPSGSQPEVSEAIAHDDNCLQEFLVTAKAVVPKLGVNYLPGVICDSSGGNSERKPQCCSVL